jgi:hypothetical protein
LDWHPNKTCGGHKYWQPPEKHCDFVRRHVGDSICIRYCLITVYHAKRGCNPVPPFRAVLCRRVVYPSYL